jgi:ryanodine receptor 2
VATVLESLQETLAEEEHILWMAFQMANGWRQARDGEVRNDSQRVHNCLVPYADLPRDVQLYDVQQVLSYPTLAEAAGFAIVATR